MNDKVILIGDRDLKLSDYEVIAYYEELELSNNRKQLGILLDWMERLFIKHYQANLIIINQNLSMAFIAVIMQRLSQLAYHGETVMNFGLVIKDNEGNLERIEIV